MRPIWVMFGRFQDRGGEMVKKAICCSGRSTPYIYRTQDEAWRNLQIAYPAQCREDRLDGTRKWFVDDVAMEFQLIADDMQIPVAARAVLLNLLGDCSGSEQAFEQFSCAFLAQHYPHLFTAK